MNIKYAKRMQNNKNNLVLLQIIKHKRSHSTNIYRQQTYFFLTTQYNLAHTTNTNTTYTREFLYYSLYAFINIHFLFFWFWTFGVQCHVSVAFFFLSFTCQFPHQRYKNTTKIVDKSPHYFPRTWNHSLHHLPNHPYPPLLHPTTLTRKPSPIQLQSIQHPKIFTEASIGY